jgi:hypothetical protein
MSIGKSKQSSSSSSTAGGTALEQTQSPYLQNLWTSGQGLANQGAGQDMGMAGYNQGMDYLNQGMAGLGGQNMQGAFSTLGRLQNPGMDPMMDVYARQLGQNFNEQIMPGLRGDAMAAGGLGSSRAGIAQGLAGARMGQQMQDFGAQLYGQNQDRALQAANAMGGLQGSISGMYGQGGQLAQQLGQFGMGVPWYAQNQMAGLLGNPLMQNLGSTSTSSSKGSGFNLALPMK